MKVSRLSTASRIALLALSLLLSSGCAAAQHLNSNQQMDHHAESRSSPESAVIPETEGWARQRLTKSPRHREWVKVKYKSAGNNTEREVSAFVVYPEVKTRATALIVIHEIFGMTDWIQSLTDELAEAGYIAIAPDLLSGVGPNGGGTGALQAQDSNGVGKAIRDLPPDQITADLNAVADYVSKLPAANGKIAVTGFCWGGSQSFRYATNNPRLKAAFVFYGSAPMNEDQRTIDKTALARIASPIYGFYAGKDTRINATLPATTDAMKELKKKYGPVIYDGAGHGFMRAGDAPPPGTDADQKSRDEYLGNKKARDEAWARWKMILGGL